MSFAGAPPKTTASLTKDLHQKFLYPGVDDRPIDPPPKESQKSRKLVDELKKWEDAPTAELSDLPEDDKDIQMMAFARSVPKKRARGGYYLRASKTSPITSTDEILRREL